MTCQGSSNDPTDLTRRRFLQGAAAMSAVAIAKPRGEVEDKLPEAFASLKPLGARVTPLTAEDFFKRLQRAQELMSETSAKYDALFVGPGSSLYYYTGIRWGLSERLLGLVLPKKGQPIVIVPAFEEGRLREQLRFPTEVRVWQEDESPTKIAAGALAERGIRSGRMAVDGAIPFTFYDRMKEAARGFEFVPADTVTIAGRARKSEKELEFMRLACEATCDVFRAVFSSLKAGMSQADIGRLVEAGFEKMKLRGGALVLLGASAALPHGTLQPKTLQDGDVVLIDGSCAVEGYESDVTRTGVFGRSSEKVARAFEIVRKAQDAALDAARAGKLSGTVDDAARKAIVDAGYGPDYKFFTHRLGHGIGLDEHEHPYLVRGSKTVLAAGMTFSNEPGIYVPGEFGVRCEDVMVIVKDGAAELLTPGFQGSLEKPLG
jgi:Xaa-Pro dipeptidase